MFDQDRYAEELIRVVDRIGVGPPEWRLWGRDARFKSLAMAACIGYAKMTDQTREEVYRELITALDVWELDDFAMSPAMGKALYRAWHKVAPHAVTDGSRRKQSMRALLGGHDDD
jgi:hypothetical protein